MHASPPMQWRRSTYSGGNNNCVETARLGEHVAVRDSKNLDAGAVTVSPTEWRALVDRVKAGELDI